jgi:hypothetical protein
VQPSRPQPPRELRASLRRQLAETLEKTRLERGTAPAVGSVQEDTTMKTKTNVKAGPWSGGVGDFASK